MRFRIYCTVIYYTLPIILIGQPYYQKVTHIPTCINIYSWWNTTFNQDGSCVSNGMLMDTVNGVSNGAAYNYVNPDGETEWLIATDSIVPVGGSVKLANGALILCGYSRYLGTTGLAAADGNVVLTRIGTNGIIQWTMAFGDSVDDVPEYIHLLPNGNIEVYGLSEDYAGNSYDLFRARISPTGTLLELLFQNSSNGTFVGPCDYDPLTGNTYMLNSGTAGTYYIKCIDSTFNLTWEYHYTTNFSTAQSINFVSNNTILVSGCTGINSSATPDAFIANFSASGTLLWAMKYNFGDVDCFIHADMLPSGKIIATGYSTAFSPFTQYGDYQPRMITMTTDQFGNPLRSAVYGQHVAATGFQTFAKNDTALYFFGEHGLNKHHDGYIYLRLDTTLTNPTFCYRDAPFDTTSISFIATAYTTTYSIVSGNVSSSIVNANFQSIPYSKFLVCPSQSFTYTADNMEPHAVTATSDSCFVFVGEGGMLTLTKYTPEGQIVWSHKYYTNSPYTNSKGVTITEASNGDLIIGHGGVHACLLRTDADGNAIWCTDKSVGGNEVSILSDVSETPQHDIVGLAGLQQGNSNARFAIIKYDSLGNTLWSKEYVNVQSSDGGVNTDSTGIALSGNSIYTAFAIRTDTAGNVIWSKELSASGNYASIALDFSERTPNGDVIFAGNLYEGNATSARRPYIVRFDSLGNLVWQKTYQPGSALVSYITSFIQLDGDQYLVTALVLTGSTNTMNSYNFRIDSGGNIIWARHTPAGPGIGVDYRKGAVGYDSSAAIPVFLWNSIADNFRFDKFTVSGVGPCTTTNGSVQAAVPTSVTISNPGLSAYNVTLTNTSLNVTMVIDSSMRQLVCVTGDTSFYNPPLGTDDFYMNASTTNKKHNAFPVPATEVLNIDGYTPGRRLSLGIFDIRGSLILQSNSTVNNEGLCSVDISFLLPGLYCFEVYDAEEGEVTHVLFIIAPR